MQDLKLNVAWPSDLELTKYYVNVLSHAKPSVCCSTFCNYFLDIERVTENAGNRDQQVGKRCGPGPMSFLSPLRRAKSPYLSPDSPNELLLFLKMKCFKKQMPLNYVVTMY